MLPYHKGIKQYQSHVTNKSLNKFNGQITIREMIRERQLKFTGHCICMSNYKRAGQPLCHLCIQDQVVFLTRLRRKMLLTDLLSPNNDDDDDDIIINFSFKILIGFLSLL